jgi:H+/Cl- antiporter ClcA
MLGGIHRFYGRPGKSETGLILEEIHEPKAVLPARFAPMVYASTLLTHLSGGSAGREGAAIQISASLCDRISNRFKLEPQERRTLLIAGISSGFGAAIGTPFAGILFGLEVIRRHGLNLRSFLHASTATFIASVIAKILPVPHLDLPRIDLKKIHLDLKATLILLISPLCFTLLVRGFFLTTHTLEKGLARMFPKPAVRGFAGGLTLLLFFMILPLDSYQGLGVEGITRAFENSAPLEAPVLKLLITALTLASGFKGGEFIPLFFIGATAGSALQGLAGLDPALLAALGCVSVFGAAAKTPFACMVLAVELFGLPILPYAVVSILGTTLLSGKNSLYHRRAEGSEK